MFFPYSPLGFHERNHFCQIHLGMIIEWNVSFAPSSYGGPLYSFWVSGKWPSSIVQSLPSYSRWYGTKYMWRNIEGLETRVLTIYSSYPNELNAHRMNEYVYAYLRTEKVWTEYSLESYWTWNWLIYPIYFPRETHHIRSGKFWPKICWPGFPFVNQKMNK
jgi:hypothetical protein